MTATATAMGEATGKTQTTKRACLARKCPHVAVMSQREEREFAVV